MTDTYKCCIVMPSFGHSAFFKNCLLVSIFSIRKFAEEIPIIIMYSDLTASQRRILDSLGCQLLEVDPSPFCVAHRPTLTEATYFKLYIQDLYSFDKVLWLDSDTVVINSLKPLFHTTHQFGTRLRKRPLHKEFKEPERLIHDLSLSRELPIIQGGVICISPSFIRKECFFERALELIDRYGYDFFLNADQGIISILLSGYQNVTDFPPAWNFCRYYDISEADLGLRDTHISTLQQAKHCGEYIRIVHWNGAQKPYQMHAMSTDGVHANETLFYSLWKRIADECFYELGLK